MIADFWFDPSCPYTWVTSRWMRQVERVRPVTVRWHVMSLSVLNEGRPDDPEGDSEGYLWGPVRVFAAAEARFGPAALGRLYTAYGERVLVPGDWTGLPAALADAGLPAQLAEAAGSTDYDDRVRASHERGIALVGRHVGTPVIAASVGGRRVAFFGPVISRVPAGEPAGRLWDGVLLVAAVPGFHELRGRPHEEPDLAG
ncbi:disulfide bond formation protein DsbA [Solwaraspora sp. WMMD1047]|uniref:mycothiol-dependent nitroreductase Rv2466c family protein n=1 Tax=Solwaraspora sp. WMMD1047 TaxID=3016102 RepID=UPI002416C768|nr:disulfide bond formation protein DsbA [Solwaraspora sp. WMMD1047]MDG4829921.1 disulfide bond formation protein DsbA [Solwaraspora sp. WMMD1047]